MRKFYKYLFIIAGSCLFSTDSFSQGSEVNPYNPLLLIPYNANGKWGASDTLGNLIVEPRFDRMDFFSKISDDFFISTVSIAQNSNQYVHNIGMRCPENLGLYYGRELRLLEAKVSIVRTNEGRFGLYNFEHEKFLIDTTCFKFDYSTADPNRIFYLTSENSVVYFNLADSKIEATQYVDFVSNVEINTSGFRTKNVSCFKKMNTWYYWSNEQLVEVPSNVLDEKGVPVKAPVYGFEVLDSRSNRPRFQEGLNLMEKSKHGNFFGPSISIPGDQNYFVVSSKGKFGVINENDELYLPVIYDDITIDYDLALFKLASNNVQGMKMLRTHYPAIEPKYETLDYRKTLAVNSNWTFAVFEGTYKGKKVFVGENGIEYYKID